MTLVIQGIVQGGQAAGGVASQGNKAAVQGIKPSLSQPLPAILKAPDEEALAELHYDQPPRARTLAGRYEQVRYLEQREQLGELFKVDLYA